MPTIVNHDVNLRCGLAKPSPELSAFLIADEHVYSLILVRFACVFDVDPEDLASFAEVLKPHGKASTAVDAYLQQINGRAPKLAEVAVIRVKIVSPLPNPWTLMVFGKILQKRVVRCISRGFGVVNQRPLIGEIQSTAKLGQ